MRIIHQVVTDEEFEKLMKAKGKRTWHKFIMLLAEKE